MPESNLMTFLRQHLTKIITLTFWVSLIAAFWIYVQVNDFSFFAAVQHLIDIVSQSTLGPLTFVLFYIVQPILFFPSSLLTIAAGYLYGPVYGAIISIIGSNGSAVLAYYVGCYFGLDFYEPNQRSNSRLQRYASRLTKNSFTAVLVMRLVYLPYDPVSYLAGFLRIRFWPFVIGTFLGSVVGTISFTLFGASVDGDFTGTPPTVDPVTLAVAIGLSVLSIIIARFIRQREEQLVEEEKEQ